MIQTCNRFRGEHFDFVAVAMSYAPPLYVRNYAETHRLPFRIVVGADGSLAQQIHNVQPTRTTYLVNGKGRVNGRISGQRSDARENDRRAAALAGIMFAVANCLNVYLACTLAR